MVIQVYHTELPLNKTNFLIPKPHFRFVFYQFQRVLLHPNFMTTALILVLTWLISRCLNGVVPRAPSYDVYIFNLFGLHVSSHLTDFNAHKKTLTAKLLQQGYRYHTIRIFFFFFFFFEPYHRQYELVSKYDSGLKILLLQGLSEHEINDD